MAPSNLRWPRCGCKERCRRVVCLRAGKRVDASALPALSTVGRKSSPERMTRFLDRLLHFPQVVKACLLVGINYTMLQNWLRRSENGRVGDGFDLTYGGETKRFHEHYADVREVAFQKIEDAYEDRALNGYKEILSEKGRVQYQYDEGLLALGLTGPEAFLRDRYGKPIPEQIQKQDKDVMLNVLKANRRERYGAREQVDVTHRGGVLVVGMKASNSQELEARERTMVANPIDVEFRELVEAKT